MKVAYLLGSLHRGGTETMVLDEFRNADKAPYVMICIHRKGGPYLDAYYAAGPKMIQCAPKRFGFVRYILNLRQILLREGATIVHAQQALDCVYAWFATLGSKTRVVMTFHSYDIGLNGFNKFIRRWAIRMADTVCFVSQAQRDYYIANYHIKQLDKLHVVYNGIDFSKFDCIKPSEDLKFEKDRVKLCMVGNFVRGRSQMVICKALQLLQSQITNEKLQITTLPSFDFYFIGRMDNAQAWRYDECVEYCNEHLLENVHFIGARSDVPALLKSMDGFIYSTVHDTFGIAVVEAIASGLPIVVNDWVVMKEVCGVANEGIRYFKTDDARDAADKIAELLANLEKSRKVAAANAERVRNQYSIENHIMRLNEIYSSMNE